MLRVVGDGVVSQDRWISNRVADETVVQGQFVRAYGYAVAVHVAASDHVGEDQRRAGGRMEVGAPGFAADVQFDLRRASYPDKFAERHRNGYGVSEPVGIVTPGSDVIATPVMVGAPAGSVLSTTSVTVTVTSREVASIVV